MNDPVLATASVIKGILAALSLVFLAAFYIHWWVYKHTHSVVGFIAKSRIVKHNKGLALALITLSAGLFIESLTDLGIVASPEWKLASVCLEIVAIASMGYWYYKLTREKVR